MTSLKCLYSHFLKKHLAPNPIRAVETQWRKQISALNRLCEVFQHSCLSPHGVGGDYTDSLDFYPHPAVTRQSLSSWWIGVWGDPWESQVSHHCQWYWSHPPPTMVSVGTTWGAGIQPYLQGHVARQYPHSYFKEIMVEEDIPSHNLIQKYIEKVSQSWWAWVTDKGSRVKW